MINRLTLKNFTVFESAELTFCRGLNVIVGVNGTGKTHLLKLGYMFDCAWPNLINKSTYLSEKRVEVYFEEKLMGLFRPARMDNVIRQGGCDGTTLEAETEGFIPTISVHMPGEQPPEPLRESPLSWKLEISNNEKNSDNAALRAILIPNDKAVNTFLPLPVFIPSKEVISFFEGLISLFKNYKIQLDETYEDLAVALTTPERQQPSELMADILSGLSKRLGGELVYEKGKFLFRQSNGDLMDAPLLAEGSRKLAMLLYLVRNDVIQKRGTLFWDEPETNLNPAFMRLVAEALVSLAAQGVQVILATHSYFLLKEIEIINARNGKKTPTRFTGITLTPYGVEVTQADKMKGLRNIVSLEEELAQYDREMEAGRG